jgi:hypothetical protein
VRIPALRRHKNKIHDATRAPVWRSSCILRTVRPVPGLAGEYTARKIARSLQPQRDRFFTRLICGAARSRARCSDHPGNPAVVGFAPLDRKFCEVHLSADCALCAAVRLAARLTRCNGCARRRGRLYEGVAGASASGAEGHKGETRLRSQTFGVCFSAAI